MFTEYVNSITKFLDKESNFQTNEVFHHYINYFDLDKGVLAIRVPGATVGAVLYDVDSLIIKKIELYSGFVTYSADLVAKINKIFVGNKYKFEDDKL